MAHGTGIKALAHNSGVSDASQALQILQRIQREFAPLLQQRGWTVRKLQEMCCCAKGGGVKRPPGVLGMNHSGAKGKYSTKIEIRLREPGSSHAFKDFESEVRAKSRKKGNSCLWKIIFQIFCMVSLQASYSLYSESCDN